MTPRALTIGIVLLAVVTAGEFLLTGSARLLWTDATWTVISASAAWCSARRARLTADPGSRRGWWWLTAGAVLWTAGMFVWSFHELALGRSAPFPSWADAGFLGMNVCALVALSQWRQAYASRAIAGKHLGDLGTVLSALFIGAGLTAQAAQQAPPSALEVALAMGYAVLQPGVFVMSLLVLWSARDVGRRRTLLLISAGCCAFAAVGTPYGILLLLGSYQVGNLLDPLWNLGFAFWIWAALDGGESLTTSGTELIPALDAIVPALAVLATIAAFIAFPEHWSDESRIVWIIAGVVLAASIGLREWSAHDLEQNLREDLERQAARFRTLVEHAPVGIATVFGSQVRISNKTFDLLARDESGNVHDAVVAVADAARAERAAPPTPTLLPVSNRTLRILATALDKDTQRSGAALLVIEDVTDEERLRVRLLRTQKIEAIGTLAGGIAHDFNNLLSGAVAGAELLTTYHQEPEALELLGEMQRSLWRAADLVQRLLALSRGAPAASTVVDPVMVADRVLRLVARLVDADVKVKLEIGVIEGSFAGDATRLEDAILNLTMNAADAMRGRSGEIVIGVAVTRDPLEVVITVRDHGVGMSADVLARATDPFFTTKAPGVGTGLGLAMVDDFVRQHDGRLELQSEVGVGTLVTLRLPATARVERGPAPTMEHELPRGNETVLVVDDHDSALFAAKALLTSCGYKVVVSSDGQEALEELARRRATSPDGGTGIDLLLVDAVMPRLNGREFLAELRRLGDRTPAILVTGFDLDAQKGAAGFVAVVGKPYDLPRLAAVVRDALDRQSLDSKP